MGDAWSDDPVVRDLRERITAVDRRILDAVNERLGLFGEMVEHKHARGYPLVDRGREEALIEALQERNGGPLSAEGVRELFELLIAIGKREIAAERQPSG